MVGIVKKSQLIVGIIKSIEIIMKKRLFICGILTILLSGCGSDNNISKLPTDIVTRLFYNSAVATAKQLHMRKYYDGSYYLLCMKGKISSKNSCNKYYIIMLTKFPKQYKFYSLKQITSLSLFERILPIYKQLVFNSIG